MCPDLNGKFHNFFFETVPNIPYHSSSAEFGRKYTNSVLLWLRQINRRLTLSIFFGLYVEQINYFQPRNCDFHQCLDLEHILCHNLNATGGEASSSERNLNKISECYLCNNLRSQRHGFRQLFSLHPSFLTNTVLDPYYR